MHLDHLCRNRRCVNLSHLEVVTPLENSLRSNNETFKHYVSRTVCDKGHPLTGENLAIRKGGGRKCKACHAEYMKAYRRKGPVKQRKPVVTPEEKDARDCVKARSGGWCEACGRNPVHDYQHRKARAHCTKAELWDVANALHVCGFGNLSGCHGDIHGEPVWAKDRGYTVESHQDPASTPVLRRGEWVLLDSQGGWEPVNPETIGGAA
jgi:hypothetical protein